ncbi:hypothetical protein [Polyangium spumosum]|uniref:Uncharacterized protein n=1 Tax=Polyangium spumosum TaxID=889282 RepID=A0A6N7Q2V7_9BACT|nr:hypothetical protein [Polyangium spumosum]MRG97536.1 hypothetical protein [Polyangium spumosum]
MTFPWMPSTSTQIRPAPAVRHVLYEFDGPKMVLAVDERGRSLLGVAADEDDEGTTRWIFAPAPPERVLVLLETRAGLRGFFEVGEIEVFDIRPRWDAIRSWSLSPGEVPEALLPDRDAALPELVAEVRERLLAEQRRPDPKARVA